MKTHIQAKAAVKAACDAVRAEKNDAGFPCIVVPYFAETQAKEAESAGEMHLAAAWFDTASAVSLGHSRGERYETAARRCRALA